VIQLQVIAAQLVFPLFVARAKQAVPFARVRAAIHQVVEISGRRAKEYLRQIGQNGVTWHLVVVDVMHEWRHDLHKVHVVLAATPHMAIRVLETIGDHQVEQEEIDVLEHFERNVNVEQNRLGVAESLQHVEELVHFGKISIKIFIEESNLRFIFISY
jgi:hypothetical protein